jgi:hypothetical protein
MTENEILFIIENEWRSQGLPAINRNSKEATALRRAARRIASDAQTEQNCAARAASIVGFAVTRGRTHP